MQVTQDSPQERGHHPFSPSSLQYREACPYFDPADGDNEASRAGTLQHDAVEAGQDNPLLTDKQAAAVADCIRYAEQVASKYPGGTILTEQYLPIDDERISYLDWDGNRHVMGGTTAGYADRIIISADGRTAEIIDWKFGQWDVEPTENNLQGMAYLLGVLKQFPNLQTVTVHFVLPHRDEVDVHTFTRSEFEGMYVRIRCVVLRAVEARKIKDFTKATPNMGACRFCANAGRCDALSSIALRIGHKFNPVKVPENINPSLLRDPKEVGLGLRVAGVIEAWAKAYKAQAGAKAIADEDFIPDGFVLVSSEKREIVDNKKFREIARQFLTDEELESATKFFITPIEDMISAKAPRGEKKATCDEFSQALIDVGAVELGLPNAFLRMDRKKKENTQK